MSKRRGFRFKLRLHGVDQYAPYLRVLIFLSFLGLLWVPIAVPIYLAGHFWGFPNAASSLAMALLYGCFICLLRRWGQQVHHWSQPLRRCGLYYSRAFALNGLIALAMGVGVVIGLFGVEVLLGWARLQTPPPNWGQILIEGLGVGIGIGFAEELLFRGWLLVELEQDCSPWVALSVTSLVYAIAHFIKPLSEITRTAPQFLGLLILGMALGWARRVPVRRVIRRGATNLGLPMGLHAGLVCAYYWVNAGDLIVYSDRVPLWVTGIDHNPLAGLLGLLLLLVIAISFASRARALTA